MAVAALLLYVPTLMPDVGTWDTAEFQSVGPVLGIAHPTGYPTYTLLAWLASVVLQPFGNEAYRVNLLSTILMAAAAALLAIRVVQATRRWPLGVLGGIVFAVTPLAWRLSTRADAHALHVFLALLVLVLLAGWQSGRDRGSARAGWWLVAAACVFGLSLGNHALTLLLAPGIAAYVLLVAPRILWQEWRLVLGCLAVLVATATLVYAYLPLRSSMEPPLDYADPETWSAFWYVVLGQQFQGSYGGLPPLPELVAGVWDEVVRNLGPLAILVPVGAVLGAFRHLRLVILTGLWFACTWLFALGYPNADIERYYLVPLAAASIWVALAADVLWDALLAATGALGLGEGPRRQAALAPQAAGSEPPGAEPAPVGAEPAPGGEPVPGGATPPLGGRGLSRRRLEQALAGALVILLLAVALSGLPARRSEADASGDRFGRDWLDATMAALAPDAVVVSWWSFSTPLWYGRWVEGRREDVLIVDDRDVLDDGYGSAEAAIDRYLGQRPVYVIRLEQDLAALAEHYRLERMDEVPGPGDLYRVLAKRKADPGQPG